MVQPFGCQKMAPGATSWKENKSSSRPICRWSLSFLASFIQIYRGSSGVLLRRASSVTSTTEAIQFPMKGSPPRLLRNNTRKVEIMANPMVTPTAHPKPVISPWLKSFLFSLPLINWGGPEGIRTPDLRNAIATR